MFLNQVIVYISIKNLNGEKNKVKVKITPIYLFNFSLDRFSHVYNHTFT